MISHNLFVSSAAFIIKQIRVWITPQPARKRPSNVSTLKSNAVKSSKCLCATFTPGLVLKGSSVELQLKGGILSFPSNLPRYNKTCISYYTSRLTLVSETWGGWGGEGEWATDQCCFCAEALTQHPEVTLKHVCLLWNTAATLPV